LQFWLWQQGSFIPPPFWHALFTHWYIADGAHSLFVSHVAVSLEGVAVAGVSSAVIVSPSIAIFSQVSLQLPSLHNFLPDFWHSVSQLAAHFELNGQSIWFAGHFIELNCICEFRFGVPEISKFIL
jgi:hypothetical protein